MLSAIGKICSEILVDRVRGVTVLRGSDEGLIDHYLNGEKMKIKNRNKLN